MTDFNIKELQKRIQEIKEEEEVTVSFTIKFIECLLERHDLQNMMDAEYTFEDIPDSIIQHVRNGEVPSKEEIESLSLDDQDFLIKDFIFICGMGAISYYSDNIDAYKEMDPKPFDAIIKMPNMSPAHHTACYIVAALALLLADIPTQSMVESLTNNFDCSEEQIENNVFLFNDLCTSIIKRYSEDKVYYLNEKL